MLVTTDAKNRLRVLVDVSILHWRCGYRGKRGVDIQRGCFNSPLEMQIKEQIKQAVNEISFNSPLEMPRGPHSAGRLGDGHGFNSPLEMLPNDMSDRISAVLYVSILHWRCRVSWTMIV